MRPMLSGLVGALVAWWLTRLWARWIPDVVGGRSRAQLDAEHGWKVRAVNALMLAGLAAGVASYPLGIASRNDWRGLGVGIFLAVTLPLLLVLLASARGGARAFKECAVLFAITQRTPLFILVPLLVLGLGVGVAALVSLG